MKNLPHDVQELFDNYTAKEIIEMFECLDLFLVNQGMKESITAQFGVRYDFTFFLLKRAIRALEPPKIVKSTEN